MLVQLLWVLAAAAVGQPTEGGQTPRDRGSEPPACVSYCRSFLSACGDSIAFATVSACTQTCADWQRKQSDAVACRVSFLAPSERSCLAAGPASPICGG